MFSKVHNRRKGFLLILRSIISASASGSKLFFFFSFCLDNWIDCLGDDPDLSNTIHNILNFQSTQKQLLLTTVKSLIMNETAIFDFHSRSK